MMLRILLGMACLMLTACGSETEVSEQGAPKKTQLEQTMSTQLDALEKAKALEQQILEDVEKRNAQIEAQGG